MTDKRMIEACVDVIREKTSLIPEIGMILGSGLGDYGDKIEDKVIIPYSTLPDFPVSTVQGHAGQFVIGTLFGKTVIAMQGRVHYYEGYSQRLITLPVRIMRRLGVEKMIITNAAGGVNRRFKPGTLMLIRDHINYSGSNPLMGENMEDFGARFPDMSCVYDTSYGDALREAAKKVGVAMEEGIYMMFSGPSYETPAEVRMAGVMGADAVGMSTVPEAIVCAHCQIPVIGISCITNMAAGILNQPLDHKEVMETAAMVKTEFVKLVDLIVSEIFI